MATVVGASLASVGRGVTRGEGTIARTGVAVGVGGFGVLVGVGVAAGPRAKGPQAIVNHRRTVSQITTQTTLRHPQLTPAIENKISPSAKI